MTLGAAGKFRSSTSILVIPDCHARADESLADFDRFIAIGKLIADIKPDVVVNIGDLGDFPSLNRWNNEGQGYSYDGRAAGRDVGAFRDAIRAIMSPVLQANHRHKTKARHPERVWQPRWVFCEGNHEEFWRRYKETDGPLLGHDYLQKIVEDAGWEWVRFKTWIDISGVLFSHFFANGTGKPIGVRQILNTFGRSCVWGHSHTFGFDSRQILGRGTISAVCAGGFRPAHRVGPHDWNGLTLLTNVVDGSFSLQQMPYDAVLERYGEGDYARMLRNARAQAAQDNEDAEFAFS